jgi:flagellar biosynthesis GTPase FlhF
MFDQTNSGSASSPGALRLKSYFSGTVEAAIDLARRELGEDAFLVNARPASAETRQYGAYEVVFGITGATPKLPPPLPAQPIHDPVQALSAEVATLRAQLQRLLGGEAPTPPESPLTDATLGRPGLEQATVMLVGPPGAGKTSTLIKIAGRYGVHANRSTHILTTDTHRVAAADQIQTLAAILGAGGDVVEPATLLPHAIAEHSEQSLVLIDTPGFALNDLSQGLDLVRGASACTMLDVHLVLPASMKPADALRLAEGYSIFRPHKLIFTRVDETIDRSSILEIQKELKLPISFFCSGPRVPEDIEPATRRKLAELVETSAPLQSRRASA